MKTKPVEKIVHISFLVVFIIGTVWMSGTAANAQESAPNPTITANAAGNWISGDYWTLGAQVAITIDNPNTLQSPDFTTTQIANDPWDGGGSFFYWSNYNFSVGDTITIADEISTKSLVISNVQITSIDVENERITGITDPNHEVWVSANEIRIQTWSGNAGDWMADFAGLSDLQIGTTGGIRVFDDDGDETRFDLQRPYIEAPVNGQWIHAREWLLDTVVTLTIDRPSTSQSPDYTTSQIVTPASWDSDINAAEFDLAGIYEFQVGDLITLSEEAFSKQLTVTNITVTEINIDTETISGTSDSGEEIMAEIWSGGAPYRKAIADDNGLWTVDFSVPWNDQGTYDLVPGLSGTARHEDDDGDFTFVEWPGRPETNPGIDARPDENAVEGHEWADGVTVALTIDDPDTSTSPDYTASQVADATLRFDLGNGFILQPGHIVTLSDGNTAKTMIVSNLAVTNIDVVNDTLSGTASSNGELWVWVKNQGDTLRHVFANENGNWFADFSIPAGQEPWELQTTDIVPGLECGAFDFNQNGDGTLIRWYVPTNRPPVAEAGLNQNILFGNTVTLDASASSDPDGDPLSYEWDLDHDGEYEDATGITIITSINQVGEHIISLRVTDNGGLGDTDTTTVTVLPWALKGFFQPVDMNGIFNIVKGGSAVPLKFEIFAGSTELTDISSIKSLTYAQATCDATAITDEIETVTTGDTSLRYSMDIGQFIYNWKTPSTPGKCYRVTLITIDGSSLVAYFKLK